MVGLYRAQARLLLSEDVGRVFGTVISCELELTLALVLFGGNQTPPRQNKKWRVPDLKNDWGSWNSIKKIIGMHSRVIGALGLLPIKK